MVSVRTLPVEAGSVNPAPRGPSVRVVVDHVDRWGAVAVGIGLAEDGHRVVFIAPTPMMTRIVRDLANSTPVVAAVPLWAVLHAASSVRSGD